MAVVLVFDNGALLTEDRSAFYGNFTDILRASPGDIETAFEAGWPDFEAGRAAEAAFWERGLAALERDANLDQLGDIARAAFQPLPGMWAMLEGLRARKIPLARLANSGREFDMYMRIKYDFIQIFRTMVSSWQAGAAMPDGKPFGMLLARLNAPPADCLFISPHAAHLDAAQTSGMDTLRFRSASELEASLRERGT